MNSNTCKTNNKSTVTSSSSSETSSSSSSSSSGLSQKCQQCVEMLQKAILDTDNDNNHNNSSPSLPLQLLQAMGATSKDSIELNPNGMTIHLPKQQYQQHHQHQQQQGGQVKLQKQWSQSLPHASMQHRSSTNTTTMVQATSANTPPPTLVQETSSSTLPQHILNDKKAYDKYYDSMKIECRPCGNDGAEGGARAFVTGPDPLSVVLCTNRLQSMEEIQQVLVHEFIHVYDVRQLRLDLTQCTNLAYSEIRAAKHAECATDNFAILPSIFQTSCIKSKATAATSNLFTKPGQAKSCINQVFTKAMEDTRPFQAYYGGRYSASSSSSTTNGASQTQTSNANLKKSTPTSSSPFPYPPSYDPNAWHSQR